MQPSGDVTLRQLIGGHVERSSSDARGLVIHLVGMNYTRTHHNQCSTYMSETVTSTTRQPGSHLAHRTLLYSVQRLQTNLHIYMSRRQRLTPRRSSLRDSDSDRGPYKRVSVEQKPRTVTLKPQVLRPHVSVTEIRRKQHFGAPYKNNNSDLNSTASGNANETSVFLRRSKLRQTQPPEIVKRASDNEYRP